MTPKTAEAPAGVAEGLALIVLQDRLADILMDSGAKKSGELVAAVDHPAVNLHVAKFAMKTSPRFYQTQMRKWDIAARWEAPDYPFETILKNLIEGVGRPVGIARVAQDIGDIVNRSPEVMADLVRRFAEDSEEFAVFGEDNVGLSEWVLQTEFYDAPADVIYYNFMEPEQVEPYRKAAEKLDWDTHAPSAAVQLVLQSKTPVPCKTVQYFAWEAQGRDVMMEDIYAALLEDEEIRISSSQLAFRKDEEKKLLDGLKKIEISEEYLEEEEAEDEPPTITDDDLDEIRRVILSKDGFGQLSDVILQIFELEEDEKAYQPTEALLVERLRHDPELLWLGGGRFAQGGSVPDEVREVPAALVIPEYDFSTPDGERFDLEMEVSGLESNLAKEVHEPLVQDVGDEDMHERPAKRPTEAACVLKYHHKQEGTYPLAQIPEGLFAAEPNVQLITLRHEGSRYEAWVNLETRLIYGLTDFYNALGLPISGGMFRLVATDDWNVFDVEYSGEADDVASVAPGRLLELLQLKEEADQERLPTFELACRLLEKASGGLSYPHLFIEINLIRRVRRMLVASLLSGYSCFTRQRSGQWTFDEKKKGQPFQKSKRKYVVKES